MAATDLCNPLVLPSKDRRTIVRTFWIVLSTLLCAVGSAVGLAFHLPWSPLFAAVFALALGCLVFVKEDFVRRLYHSWNNRLAFPVARLVSSCLMGICLFVIFTATGRFGSRLRLSTVSRGTWLSRISPATKIPEQPIATGEEFSSHSNWIKTYIRWAWSSGNLWSIVIIPFLFVLRSISRHEEKAIEANVYTLF